MSKTQFDLLDLLESIKKIKLYSQDFTNADDFYHDQKSFDASMMQFVGIDADEIWDIINNKLIPLENELKNLIDSEKNSCE